jgi:sterol desaturase/sphingolipid hydroxylase (fatty acid hydroxylase superfamily)
MLWLLQVVYALLIILHPFTDRGAVMNSLSSVCGDSPRVSLLMFGMFSPVLLRLPGLLFYQIVERLPSLHIYRIGTGPPPLTWCTVMATARQYLVIWIGLIVPGAIIGALGVLPWQLLPETLPLRSSVLLQTIFALIWFDVTFHATHWAQHRSRRLYTLLHKHHHRHARVSALACFDSSVGEYAVSNGISVGLYFALFPSHVWVMFIFSVMILNWDVVHHSGYALPWSPCYTLPGARRAARHHAGHHTCHDKHLGGVWGLLDHVSNLFSRSESKKLPPIESF